METVKKTYEEPSVRKVEFDFRTRIAASGCTLDGGGEVYCGGDLAS